VHLLMAAAIAIGFRHPWAWSFVLLTKVTPGIGLLWFALRREWRALAIAVGATIGVSAVSIVVAPGLWRGWLEVLVANAAQPSDLSIPPPLVIRLPVAVLVVAWGALTDRPWTVPVAAMLALPILWPHGLVVALGAVPLVRQRAAETGGQDTGLGVDVRALSRRWPVDWQLAAESAGLRRLVACAGAGLLVAAVVSAVATPIMRAVLQGASANLRP
jgi:hypothetical protein